MRAQASVVAKRLLIVEAYQQLQRSTAAYSGGRKEEKEGADEASSRGDKRQREKTVIFLPLRIEALFGSSRESLRKSK